MLSGCLDGLVVLDLSRVLAGPYCTLLLADLGANVIKIEMPKTGDDSRAIGPFINKESAYFMSINRNKRSITLNLKSSEGKEIFKELLKRADIVVENYRPGTMEKLGLGYEELKQVNPRIIYAACSGFGATGPYKHKPAYDIIVQAAGGLMSITGAEGGEPTRVGASIGDVVGGLFTCIGILAAVYNRQLTGEGQAVDCSMLDCQVAILENAIARYYATGKPPVPIGNRHPSVAPFEPFKTKTNYLIIAIANDNLWQKLCNVLERKDLIDDPRFAVNPQRAANISELRKILREIFLTKTAEEWMDILDEAGIPNGPINTIEDVVNHPQILSRDMIVELEHPVAGKYKAAGIPIKLSRTPGQLKSAAPLLGMHNAEIYGELLGYSKEKLEELNTKGII